METEKSCYTCLYMATHEKCDNCLRDTEDYKKEPLPEFRYLNYTESDPLEQMRRLHDLQLKGHRCITLGPGEADIYATSTPEETSKNLHYTAEQCGYFCGTIKHNGAHKTLTLLKDWGPFCLYWENDVLMRITQGEETIKTYWDRKGF